MYEMFEQAVRKLKKYNFISLCEILRGKEDTRKPSDYRPLDAFWESQGYQILDGVTASFSYQEIGENKKTSHAMTFREKKLTK